MRDAVTVVVGVLALTFTAPELCAGPFFFQGTFSADDDIQLFDFTVGAPSTVTLKSYGYAGGMRADGSVVPDGGFDTILSLFDSSGNLIGKNDDGDFPDVNFDPTTGNAYDTFLKVDLAPGDYTTVVSQFDNFFSGDVGDNISEGFDMQGFPTFTGDEYPQYAGMMFIDVDGNQRTNFWAFGILGVDVASAPNAIPEVSTFTLVSIGYVMAGCAWYRRRRKRTISNR